MLKFLLPILLLVSGALSASEFKVVTLNVYRKPEIGADFFGTERMNKICEVLKNEEHPDNNGWDIVLIQEAWTVGSRKILKNCGYPHIVDIGIGRWRAGWGVRHRRGGIRPRPGRHGREPNLESGLLILSKFPIKKSLRYKFKNEGQLSRVFRDGESAAAKSIDLAQVELSDLKKVFDEWVGNEPLVFGGDLNAGEHPSAKDLSWVTLPKLFPGFEQAPHDEIAVSISSPSNYFKKGHKEGGKLDHIFASPHFDIYHGKLAFEKTFISSKGEKLNYSDHYGWESTVILK
jgi:hypothetical protein